MRTFVTSLSCFTIAENLPNPRLPDVSGTNRRIFLVAHSTELVTLSNRAIEFYCLLCGHVRVVREPIELPIDRRLEVEQGLWDGAIDELVSANLVEVEQ